MYAAFSSLKLPVVYWLIAQQKDHTDADAKTFGCTNHKIIWFKLARLLTWDLAQLIGRWYSKHEGESSNPFKYIMFSERFIQIFQKVDESGRSLFDIFGLDGESPEG